jgi:hypothetical protein
MEVRVRATILRRDEKSQNVPFQGRHDCRLTTACTNETHKNKWVRAWATIAPFSLCETNAVQGQRICFCYGVQRELYNCEILISEIERRSALYDCSLKEYSDKGLKERLQGKSVRGSRLFLRAAKRMVQSNGKASSVIFNIINTNAQVYINLL